MHPADLLELAGSRRTPLILQSEESECGLACLAMVATRHGFKTDMPSLRRKFRISLKGTTLKVLMAIAEELGFTARPLRGELAELRQLSLPAILHWDLNHFVVLTNISHGLGGTRFHIHDPAKGAMSLKAPEFSKHFTGVVLELTRGETFSPRVERAKMSISQLWSKISGLWASLRSILLLSIVLQAVALATPFYLQLAVDTVFPTFDHDLLVMLAIGFGGLAVINMLSAWLRSLLIVGLGSALSYQIIVNLYCHLLRLPLPWFERRHVGDIVSRFSSTQPISQLITQGLIAAVIDGAMAFITLGLMFIYSPMLASIALGAWVIFAVGKFGLIHVIRLQNIDAITAAAKENSSFIESIRGISAIKAFGQERNRQRAWQQLKAEAVNAQIKVGRTTAGFEAFGQFVIAIERVIFVYFAISMAMEGSFTVGMVFAFQGYKQQFLDAATRLVEQAIQYRLLDVHLDRIADIALGQPERQGTGIESTSSQRSASVELRNLGFQYGTGENPVFRGVNLHIPQGEMVVFVGPSGGGKTTLLKVMMGLFQPGEGSVLVDGRPLGADLAGWRRRCGSVMQDDALYAGSLADNIAFFDPDLDMARVYQVARQAFIHDDIMAMPLKYDTLVGDMGSTLSGGQKQRVLLARALYGDPQILFIDEGTAHLDPQVEHSVAGILAELPITRVMVAHRPQALVGANRLFRVCEGGIEEVEMGPAGKIANVA